MCNSDGGASCSRENVHGEEAYEIFQLDRHRDKRFALAAAVCEYANTFIPSSALSVYWIQERAVVSKHCTRRHSESEYLCDL